ncbi:hypothetical protein CDAR_106231 [Caerostris darwini]|uniref:Prolactin receptor n=1 Tax=Caerostris darwini TaxID=1538125 RepID=A0AAV4SIW8_9ARAC|nr:hypothetical protein CDAR_106231 [Caerostris darwini]
MPSSSVGSADDEKLAGDESDFCAGKLHGPNQIRSLWKEDSAEKSIYSQPSNNRPNCDQPSHLHPHNKPSSSVGSADDEKLAGEESDFCAGKLLAPN